MKLGIIGAGAIAEIMANTIKGLEDVEAYAIASRSLEKAEEFKKQNGFEKAYGSYEELVKDPKVDLIYIATPHSEHYKNMKLCIENHKAILCEKAFTVNAKQAKEIVELARKENVYVAEAIWTRYMPSRVLINEAIKEIGNVNIITANLAYPIKFKQRMTDPYLAGGTLLDLGVYGLNFASMIFGDNFEKIDTSVTFTDTGVDESEVFNVIYPDKRMAILTHSMLSRGDRKGIIYGEKGYIVIENINNPNSIKIFDTDDNLVKDIPIQKQITGYEYEVIEAMKCLKEGRIESYSMPLSETIKIMEIMDSIRESWNFKYPFEKNLARNS